MLLLFFTQLPFYLLHLIVFFIIYFTFSISFTDFCDAFIGRVLVHELYIKFAIQINMSYLLTNCLVKTLMDSTVFSAIASPPEVALPVLATVPPTVQMRAH